MSVPDIVAAVDKGVVVAVIGEEVMAAEILRTGQVVVSGDGYPSTTVNFGRDAALTKALTGSATWETAAVNPIEDLEDWADLVQTKSGMIAKTVIIPTAINKSPVSIFSISPI